MSAERIDGRSFIAWALPNLAWLIVAHLVATPVWLVGSQLVRGGQSLAESMTGAVAGLIIGIYVPVLYAIPAALYEVVLWYAIGQVPVSARRVFAVALAPLLMTPVLVVLLGLHRIVAGSAVPSPEDPTMLLQWATYGLLLPSVFAVLIRLPRRLAP